MDNHKGNVIAGHAFMVSGANTMKLEGSDCETCFFAFVKLTCFYCWVEHQNIDGKKDCETFSPIGKDEKRYNE